MDQENWNTKFRVSKKEKENRQRYSKVINLKLLGNLPHKNICPVHMLDAYFSF